MDFYFPDTLPLDLGSPREKFENNLDAIRLAKELAALGRAAFPDEQAILSRYVGFGDAAVLRQLNGANVSHLLTDEELHSARASSLNAHYTALPVIGAMWSALTHMGLGATHFRVLDPSAGIGHFKSATPIALRDKAEWAEIELDSLTASILKLLHPESKIFAQGYEKTDLPANWFDLAISNVPFGDYGVYKRDVPSFLRKSIHDFFFANTVSVLRPGGILAFITSRYTLDKKANAVRTWLARRLDLLAAVRLPETAFRVNAGTQVVTDILILRKREEDAPDLPVWVETGDFKVGYRSPVPVNTYYLQNPHMVMGTPSMNGTMYRSDGYTVEADGRDLGQAITEALRSVLPTDLFAAPDDSVPEVATDGKGKVFVTLSAAPSDRRMEGLIAIYTAAKELLAAETSGESIVDTSLLRRKLNDTYDAFTAEFGPVNKPANVRALGSSPEAPFLKALEEYDSPSATARKAGLFTEPMVRSLARQSDTLSVDDALLVCLDRAGRVDLPTIARLCTLPEAAVIEGLKGRIFRLSSGKGWVTADEYLSGNVRVKLCEAQAAAAFDDSYQENVAALEPVIPPDLTTGIRAPLGANWIPAEVVAQFCQHLAGVDGFHINHVPGLATWEIDATNGWKIPNSVGNSRWGTVRVHMLELLDAALNSRSVTVWDYVEGGPDDQEQRVVNQTETVAAQAKLGEIKAEFETWLWSDVARATSLRAIYNERFNAIRARKYDGSHLSTPGLSKGITLRQHQKNLVWRILQSQSTVADHKVGAGKTLAGIVAAMEAKRLHLAKKTMIVVPNHLTSQWHLAAIAAYPGANILVPSLSDFEMANRGEFLSRIATNDWDIVIVPFSSFKLLPVSPETLAAHYRQEIEVLNEYLYELKAEIGNTRSSATKEIEKSLKRMTAKLEALGDMKKDDLKTITFEELGVDMLIVDEFHAYKNLYFHTRMTRIAGLTNSDSQRAFDMFIKVRWMQAHGRKVVGMTGTPVTNTLAELYTMQRYFQLETLHDLGLTHFDAWASQFALAEPGLEMTPDGSGFRMNTRFRKFVNLPELMQTWSQVCDAYVIDASSGIERPDLFNGKPVKVLSDGGKELLDYVAELGSRAEKVRAGLVQPWDDNMLCITGDGRKAALDMSLVVPAAAGTPMPKVDMLVDLVAEIFTLTSPVQGTQLIFCDLATPKGS
jgi:N12 class adenine-specific DNA methylase